MSVAVFLLHLLVHIFFCECLFQNLFFFPRSERLIGFMFGELGWERCLCTKTFRFKIIEVIINLFIFGPDAFCIAWLYDRDIRRCFSCESEEQQRSSAAHKQTHIKKYDMHIFGSYFFPRFFGYQKFGNNRTSSRFVLVLFYIELYLIGSQAVAKLLILFYDGCLWRLRLMTKIKSEHLKSSRTNHDVI